MPAEASRNEKRRGGSADRLWKIYDLLLLHKGQTTVPKGDETYRNGIHFPVRLLVGRACRHQLSGDTTK